MGDPLPRWAVWTLEVALLGLLAGSWIGGWIATRSNLDALPDGSRRVALRFWSTDDRLWLVPIFVGVTLLLLVTRHRLPEVSFWLGTAAVVVYSFLFPLVDIAEFGSTLAMLLLTFWAVSRGRHLVIVSIAALVAAALTTWPQYGAQQNMAGSGQSQSPMLTSVAETVARVAVVAMVIAAAWLMQRLRSQASELAARNRELHDRRVEAAQAAVVDERLRISRELHDVVAHHISTMTVHAGGAQKSLRSNPEAANASLEQIAQAGRDAIGELQRMLGFLRGQSSPDGEPRSPSPSLRYLDRLVASFGHDLEVEVDLVGRTNELPASVDLSAYRIVQEALTNVSKHSDAAKAHVSISTNDAATTITIINEGPAMSEGDRAIDGTGHGLIGMRERTALHAGSLDIGPSDGGGWRISAVLRHNSLTGSNGARP